MAKVLNGPVKWTHKWKCTGCKARVEFEMSDVKYGDSGLDAAGGFYVECPVCGTQHDIKNPPPFVEKHALRNI